MEYEIIDTKETILIPCSMSTRHLGYPRKVPLWKVDIELPKECKILRNSKNSDISLEISNHMATAFIPALTKKESIYRLKSLFPIINIIKNIKRI